MRVLLLALAIGTPAVTNAAIITDFQSSAASQTAFPISSTDLINSGSAALDQFSGSNYVASPIDSYGPISALIDGDAGGITGFIASPGGVMDLDGTWSFQVDFALTGSPAGYDITSIETITGHTDNRKSQAYSLWMSHVGDNSFFQVGTFDYSFDNQDSGSTRLTISDDTGLIASHVDSIRWEVTMPESGFATVYREFDVNGVPTVPEPVSGITWLAIAGLAIGSRQLAVRFKKG